VLAACEEAARAARPGRVAVTAASPAAAPGRPSGWSPTDGPFAGLRVALVHDWLTGMRGGERVVDALLELMPQAELFTLVHRPGSVSERIEARRIHTSFVQALPGVQRHYRWYLPLFSRAIERFDFGGFDLVVSSSHCVAKGAITRGIPHLCYCHTPVRYAWDQFDAYFGKGRSRLPIRLAAGAVTRSLRDWDRRTADRVHAFVANSNHVRERIRMAYGRDARVIHPPVDLDRFAPAPAREDFYLIVSALVPYKRIDIAVEAMTRLGRPLVVVGSGPELPRLRALAGPTVRFTGWLSDAEVAELMGRCRALLMPGLEDFGLVPVEAQAAGAPVIALGAGGVLDTVVDAAAGADATGVLFALPTADGLREAVLRFEELRIDPDALVRNVRRFHPDRFREGMTDALEQLLGRSAESALSR